MHSTGSKRKQKLEAVELPDALDLSRIHPVTERHVEAIGMPLSKELSINGVGMPELTTRGHDSWFRPLGAEEMEPPRSNILRFAGYHSNEFRPTVAHAVANAR
jgi:hypothetical protein